MIDKEKYIPHIRDEDLRFLLVQILDSVEIVIRNHDIKTSDFLNLYEINETIKILHSFNNISWSTNGGYEDAERKVLIIYHDYIVADTIENPLACLKITKNTKIGNLNHRDYLGALLSLGIKREKVGDIVLHENGSYVILKKELKDFVKFNLDKVRNISISVEEIDFKDMRPLETKYKNIVGTVASLRLDNIISLALKISRTDAQNLVDLDRVYVNWALVDKSSYEIKENDVLSIRGRGRVIVDEIQGKTKKNRIHIKLKKPI